jgi:hypothetical protein
MSPAIDQFGFVSEIRWESAYYSAMAMVSKAAEAIHEKAKDIPLSLRFWHIAYSMRDLAKILGSSSSTSASAGTRQSADEPADLDTVAEQMDALVNKWNLLYQDCKRYNYTNRTLTAAPIRSIHGYVASVAEFSMKVHGLVERRARQIFDEARQDREVHGTVPMSSIF